MGKCIGPNQQPCGSQSWGLLLIKGIFSFLRTCNKWRKILPEANLGKTFQKYNNHTHKHLQQLLHEITTGGIISLHNIFNVNHFDSVTLGVPKTWVQSDCLDNIWSLVFPFFCRYGRTKDVHFKHDNLQALCWGRDSRWLTIRAAFHKENKLSVETSKLALDFWQTNWKYFECQFWTGCAGLGPKQHQGVAASPQSWAVTTTVSMIQWQQDNQESSRHGSMLLGGREHI